VAALAHGSVRAPERRPVGEAALLLALAPLSVAAEKGWPVLAVLDAPGAGDPDLAVGSAAPCLLGAEGTLEIAEALHRLREGAGAVRVGWGSGTGLTFRAAPAAEPRDRPALAEPVRSGRTEARWPA
jgi:hypothetical protein